MYTINHSLRFQPRGTVSGLSHETAVHEQKTFATPQRAESSANVVRLDANKLAVIQSGRRVNITCLEGVLWVTEDWNPTDVLLRSGESFKSTNAGRIIIDAFEPSTYRAAVDRTSWPSRSWQFVAQQFDVVVRALRAGVRALQAERLDRIRREPLPYY
jgi:hypothetical protein